MMNGSARLKHLEIVAKHLHLNVLVMEMSSAIMIVIMATMEIELPYTQCGIVVTLLRVDLGLRPLKDCFTVAISITLEAMPAG